MHFPRKELQAILAMTRPMLCDREERSRYQSLQSILSREEHSSPSDTDPTMPSQLSSRILLVWIKKSWVDYLMATDEPTISQEDAPEVEQESEKVQPDPDPVDTSQTGITSPMD